MRGRNLTVERVGATLGARGWTLATAESCTAGLLAGALTQVAGASEWFRGGVVVYSDDLKVSLADVDRTTIAEHGAVSREVAVELACGVRVTCKADVGVGITGIAGPLGGTVEKPVGTVHIAVTGPNDTIDLRLHLEGDREMVRQETVLYAMREILRFCGVTGAVASSSEEEHR